MRPLLSFSGQRVTLGSYGGLNVGHRATREKLDATDSPSTGISTTIRWTVGLCATPSVLLNAGYKAFVFVSFPQTAVFTPAYGSVTNVRINSCMTTPQVLKVLLNKFKIENSPDDFAIYLVHASGGESRGFHSGLQRQQRHRQNLTTHKRKDIDLYLLCWCFRASKTEAQRLSSGAEGHAGSMWAGLQGFPDGRRPRRRSHIWCNAAYSTDTPKDNSWHLMFFCHNAIHFSFVAWLNKNVMRVHYAAIEVAL